MPKTKTKRPAAPDPAARRRTRRAVSLGLAVFAAGVLALIYLRTL